MIVSLLPEKHVPTSESLLGIGAIVLSLIATAPLNLDSLWAKVKELDILKRRVHGTITFDRVILAVDFLFAIGAIQLSHQGLLEHASN